MIIRIEPNSGCLTHCSLVTLFSHSENEGYDNLITANVAQRAVDNDREVCMYNVISIFSQPPRQ